MCFKLFSEQLHGYVYSASEGTCAARVGKKMLLHSTYFIRLMVEYGFASPAPLPPPLLEGGGGQDHFGVKSTFFVN